MWLGSTHASIRSYCKEKKKEEDGEKKENDLNGPTLKKNCCYFYSFALKLSNPTCQNLKCQKNRLTLTVIDGFNWAPAVILASNKKWLNLEKKQSEVTMRDHKVRPFISLSAAGHKLTFKSISHCESCHNPNSKVTFSDVVFSCLFKAS